MGNHRLGPPEAFVLALCRETGIQVFVETGTWKAATTVWAANHFRQVITIEANAVRHQRAITNYATKYNDVIWIHGDSKLMLAGALEAVDEPVIFWLDAHEPKAHGPERGLVEAVTENPVLDEIAIINQHPYAADHVIMVDDVRFLDGSVTTPDDFEFYPELIDVILAVTAHDRLFVTHEDVLFAWPARWDYTARQFLGTV